MLTQRSLFTGFLLTSLAFACGDSSSTTESPTPSSGGSAGAGGAGNGGSNASGEGGSAGKNSAGQSGANPGGSAGNEAGGTSGTSGSAGSENEAGSGGNDTAGSGGSDAAGSGGSDAGSGGSDAGAGGSDAGSGGSDAGSGGSDAGAGGSDAGSGGSDAGSGGSDAGSGGSDAGSGGSDAAGNGGAGGAAACPEGVTGAKCDACLPGYRPKIVPLGEPLQCELDEPNASALTLWLDAQRDDRIKTTAQGDVFQWFSRVPGDNAFFSDGGMSTVRPKRALAKDGSGYWVVFDGVDDHLRRLVNFKTDTYSIFLVVDAADSAIDQTFLSGIEPGGINHGIQLQARDKTTSVFFRHHAPFVGGTNDDTKATNYPTTAPTIVEVHRGMINNQPLYSVYNGKGYTNAAGQSPSFDSDLMLHLGILGNSKTFPLKGAIGELLIYPDIIPLGDRPKIRAYLQAKWKL